MVVVVARTGRWAERAMGTAQDVQFLKQAAFLNGQEIADGLLASQLSP
jgi:hypothetical protein